MDARFWLVFSSLLVLHVSVVSTQRNLRNNYRCPREKEGLPMDGPCGQRCICLDGWLEYCCRQRKNFASMTRSERLLFVKTYKTASTDPRYRREYQQLISIHKQLFNTGIHDKDQFLPWHRWYLLRFENFLRKIDCRVTLPYWDWSLFPGAAWRKGVDDIWANKPWGLGGNGGRLRKGRAACVKNGPFSRRQKWRITPSGGRGCLRRAFSARPPDIIAVYLTKSISPRRFNDFELELRANLHDTVHCRVGGTMCDHNSANAPEFFLHHCFIDKIWADWQEKGTSHLNAYYYRLPGYIRLRRAGFLPRDYIDTLYLPHPDIDSYNRNKICVVYKDPVHPVYDEIMSRLESLSIRKIRQIRRRPFRPANRRQLKRLGVKSGERRLSRKLLKKVEPRKIIRRNRGLESIIDKWLGFALKVIPFKITPVRHSYRSQSHRDARWLANALNSTRSTEGDNFNFGNVSDVSV